MNVNDENVLKLFEELSALGEVEAIALGGSRAGDTFDEASDYDVYLYVNKQIPNNVRMNILSKYCRIIELGNHFWEYEDNCVLKSGTDIDILYRNLDDFTKEISGVVDGFCAHNAYTTCMWHNLKFCKIIYDKCGRLAKLQKRYNCPYPRELKENIIDRNMRLLRRALPAYETQIKKAVERRDIVSINHRITEFIASYFDVIFALNETTHPGEKRLIPYCEKNCKLLPENFAENLNRLFSDIAEPQNVTGDIDTIISELEKIL